MSEELKEEIFWKGMAKKHWPAILIFGLACLGFFIWFFTIILMYVDNSDIGGYGEWFLTDFSIGTGILWLLVLIGWELLLAVLPTVGILCLIVAIYWFAILPEEDKEAIKTRERKDKKKKYRKTEGGGFTFLITIAFLIVVFVQDQWLTPIGNLPYSYWIGAYLQGFIWVCIIAGIPILILILIYIFVKSKKSE